MEIIKSGILGAVQGLTEFLPVSSSGHLVLLHEWLAVHAGEADLAFDAMLHFATAAAVIVYFRGDIVSLVRAFFALLRRVHKPGEFNREEHMVLAIIVGTIPAVVLGLFFEDVMDTLFRNPLLVAATLVAGSLIMLAAERFSQPQLNFGVGWKKGLAIGLWQSLALVPGMSRSGMTISGGMLLGLSREFAAKFGFLLGVPVMLGAGAKKFFDLVSADLLGGIGVEVFIGAVVAFLVGIAVVHYLLRFLSRHSLKVFVWYRIVLAGVIVLVALL